MIRASITGISEFQELLKKINEKNLRSTVKEAVDDAAELTRAYAPLKTGRLEESIRVIKEGDGKYSIVVSVPYAEAMEYGTKYFPVPDDIQNPMSRTSSSGKPCFHPFMRPAIYQTMHEYPEIIKRALFGNK